ncbi:FAD-dependent monooxygenase [Streptomyces sp. GKU 257-1]|nr:FAD-dependent monooxygenase [Streptomyces sp. GKU 257-1]
MDTHTQAVVIGAGPCGLATAGQLLRRGARVRIFEALPEPAQGSRARSCSGRRPRRHWTTWTCWTRHAVRRTPQVGSTTTATPDGSSASGCTPGRHRWYCPSPVPTRSWNPPSGGPAAPWNGTAGWSPSPSGDDTVEVVVRDGAGRHERLRTRWLIGADGVHSTRCVNCSVSLSPAAHCPPRSSSPRGR